MLNKSNSVVYLQGGLGNQLFQYSYFLYLLDGDNKTELDIGRLLYDRQHNNISVVDFFQLKNNSYKASENKALNHLIRDSIFAKYIRYVRRVFNIRNMMHSHYDYDAMSTLPSLGNRRIDYVGYFQFVDSALFSKSSLECKLKKLYGSKLNFYKERYEGKVGLHIRRGDFVLSKDPKHDCIGLDYIKKAIDDSKSSVVVFSDDIRWCKENLSEYSALEFHCGDSAFDDFLALSQCSEYILSGSTFSWWAAFLFSSSETKITFPEGQKAQFLSKSSNEKVGWIYSTL
jgi:hypothetical protein